MIWPWCDLRPSERHTRAMRELNRQFPLDVLCGKRAWNRLHRQRDRLYRKLMAA